MFVLNCWLYTFRKAGVGGQTPSPGRNLDDGTCGGHKGLARGVDSGLLPGN